MNIKNESRLNNLATLIGADSDALVKRIDHDTRELAAMADGVLGCSTVNKSGEVNVTKKGGSVKKVKETHALRLIAISNALNALADLGLVVNEAELSASLEKTAAYADESAKWLVEQREKRGQRETVEIK